MTSRHMSRLLIGTLAAATMATTAVFADNGVGNVGEAINFVEKPGYLEFSGAMIARPVQDDATLNSAGARLIEQNFVVSMYIDPNDEYVFELPVGMGENEAARALMATGNFEYVEPDWICYPQLVPNDPNRGSQWHHAKMESYAAWDTHTGDPNTVVGICDTGLRTTHEEFQQHRQEGYNAVRFRWENQGGNVSDINGHGTHTSGCAAANGNNSRGGLGVGWSIGHRILRVSESAGGGANFSTLTHAALVAAQNGDKCSSVSYSGSQNSSVRTTGQSIRNLGGILFWAAGNESRNLSSPPRDDDKVIIVGATNTADVRASFSNYGNYVDLFAPGDAIFSTYHQHNSSYAVLGGTSMACPIAAGAAAMIFSNNPGISADDVEDLLKSTCTDIGAQGVDSIYGYGRVNLKNAMQASAVQLEVSPPNLRSREFVSFEVTGGEPNTLTGVYYSTAGLGSTYIPQLNVTLGIRNPKQVPQLKNTNNSGSATWSNLRVPSVNRRVSVWFQAAQQNGGLTEIFETWVDP